MFKFLFGGAREKVSETQRQVIERALGEVNDIVAELEKKPALRYDPQSGAISLELPEQMPDEALALPAPEKDTPQDDTKADDTPKETSDTEPSDETADEKPTS